MILILNMRIGGVLR